MNNRASSRGASILGDGGSMRETNPWSNSRAVGSRNTILELAEYTGFILPELDDKKIEELWKSSPSLRLINAQRRINLSKRDLHQVNLEIQCHLQDKETKDITHSEILEERLQSVRNMIEYLETIIKEKESLIGRLQQPFVNDQLKIDAAYQKHASEVIPSIIPLLSDLPAALSNIEWGSNMIQNDSRLNELTTSTASVISSQQAIHQQIFRIRTKMRHIRSKASESVMNDSALVAPATANSLQ